MTGTAREQTSEPATSSDLVETVLGAYDLAMLATASRFDLSRRTHRRESARLLARLFFELVGLAEVDLFVEAGAKEATASKRAKGEHGVARVVAFEANPYTYQKFSPMLAGTGVEYVHHALNEHGGPVTFHVIRDEHGRASSAGRSSILPRVEARFAKRGFIEAVVPGIRMDDFFADHPFERAAVWVDVEGACGLVLPGARDVLSRSAVVIVEVEDENYWGPGHWLQPRVVRYLFDLGLVPVARDFEFTAQYNIVFVRNELLHGSPAVRRELAKFASQAYAPDLPAAPSFAVRAGRKIRRLVAARTTR